MPVDQSKKKRVMVNLDKALAMLVDEAAALERRSAASWLTNTIEDKLRQLPDDQFQKLIERVHYKLEAMTPESTSDVADKKVINFQLTQLEMKWADLQYMDKT